MPDRDPYAYHGSEIAVIGLAGRFPGARSAEELWRNLAAGTETIRDLSDEELEAAGVPREERERPGYVRRAAWLEDIELFDAAFFGFTPREAELMDPQQRLFLECAWEALEHAGYDARRTGGPVGVFAGGKMGTYIFNLTTNPGTAGLDTVTLGLGNDIGLLAMRVAHALGLTGPAYFVQSACSTGLVATHLACQSLLLDECRMALAGAVAIDVPNKRGYLHQPSGILSADGRVRAFDAGASGTVFGSGLGVVVLKRLEDAVADGDRIHAVIKGSATNNDGSAKPNFTAPSVEGQAGVILRALVAAEVSPETLSYVEAHGTGTALGDPVEIRALSRAWRRFTDRRSFCALGTIKSNLGHLDAAAGASALIKTVLALDRGLLPPSLHFREANPEIDFAATPFFVNTELSPWPGDGRRRRAGVSSFGFGGTNCHAVLEGAPPPRPGSPGRPWQLLTVSARTPAALEAASDRLAEHFREHPETPLADAAYTLEVGRRTFPCRRALVASTAGEAAEILEGRAGRLASRVVSGVAEAEDRPVAFLLSGQGSQYPGMARGLYETEATFRTRLDESAEILRPVLGEDPRRRLFGGGGGDGGDLTGTALAQPLLFVVEHALAALLGELGVVPAALLGHSLGELVAACLAGVLSLEDALRLVAVRGRLMAEMPPGAMLAVGLPEAALAERLAEVGAEVGEELALAAVNAPERTVASGPAEAIAELERVLAAAGVRCRRLHTSHAFHSAMMEPAVEPFRAEVARLELAPPRVPFVSNVTGTWITDEQATDPGYWASQLRRPVRFADGVATLASSTAGGPPVLVEVGPGNALVTLANDSLRAAGGAAEAVPCLPHPDDRRPDPVVLWSALGRLFTLGARRDGEARFLGERRLRVPLPTYPFERERFWIEAGRGPLPGAADGRIRKDPDLSRWFYLPAWAPALPPDRPPALPPDRPGAAAASGRWLVLADAAGVGEALVRRLRAEGREVAVARSEAGAAFGRGSDGAWVLDPGEPEGYRRLLEESARAAGGPPGAVVHLWGIGTPEEDGARSGPESFRHWQERGYYSLLALAAALPEGEPAALLAVTTRMHEVPGGEPPVPEKAPLAGACLVVPQERQELTCRSVDLDRASLADPAARETLVGHLLAEAEELAAPALGPRDAVVTYRGGRRMVRRYERVPLPVAGGEGVAAPLRERGVYLVTGGLGAVGSLVAEHLARAARARLVLVGRSGLPERAEWDARLAAAGDDDPTARRIRRVLALEEAGAEVAVVTADVAEPVGAAAAVRAARERFGALHGVFHLAGALAGDSIYRPFADIDRAAEEQFAPKAHALFALERALDEDAAAGAPGPDFRLLFSSNASVLGGLGFAAYAAANAFVDAFAASRDRSAAGGPRWLAAGWDEWPAQALATERPIETGMSELAMTAEEGAEALDRLLAAGAGGHVVVATGDLAARLDVYVRRDPARLRGPVAGHARPELETAFEAPRSELEERVAAVWQDLLGIERVGIHDNFFDLGGHSLLATQLLGRLQRELGVELPLQRLFEGPTVAGVAEAAAEAGAAGAETPALRDRAPEEASAARPGSGAIPRRPPGTDRLPLSFAQERMWFLERIDAGSAAYNLLTPARLEGPLDPPVLARAFAALVRRHESLRTLFAEEAGRPVQVVAPSLALPLPVADLSALPPARREAETLAHAATVKAAPFDLARGPLLRVVLVRLAPRDHALLLVMHHIVSDGWSMGVLIEELAALADAFGAGRPSPLPDLSLQYPDFALWQRERLRGEALEAHLAYWRERLGGDLPVLRLATDRPRSAPGTPQPFRAAAESTTLPAGLWRRVRELSRREGATPFMTLLAAFQTLLYRYTGQRDVLVGCPIANRNHPETEGLIGFFLNTLLLRADLRGGAGFRELLAQVAEAAVGAYAHQDLPLETLLQTLELRPEGDRREGGLSFFQAMFLFQNMPAPRLELGDLSLSVLRPASRIDLGSAIYDLNLAAEERGDELVAWVSYNALLFGPPTVRRFLDHLESLLGAVVEDPERSLDALPLAREAERREVLAWGAGAAREPIAETVVELFARRAAAEPGALALAAGGRHLTYGGLRARALTLAGALAERLAAVGAGAEARVGLFLERSPEMVVAMLGILEAGAAYVPLDPAYPEERIAFVARDAGLAAVVTSRELAPRLADLGARLLVLAPEAGPAAAPARELPPLTPAPDPETAAYLIYTSGSTGRPKGVTVSHRAMAGFVRSARELYRIGPGDRVLQFASVSFDTSVEEIFPALTSGAALVLRDEEMLRSPAGFLAACREAGVSVLDLPTAWFHELMAGLGPEERVGAPLRLVILGGERVVPSRLAELARRLEPGVRVVNTYGPTEATVVATLSEPLADDPEGLAAGREVPIGRPLPGVRAAVLDPLVEPAPVGVPGELALGGGGLARGYLGRPALTAERFIPDPHSAAPGGRAGGRLYLTGDRARWREDGLLEFLGRLDQQIKVRGFRVEPGEIEACLTACPGVGEAAVVAREDAPGAVRLVAYAVGRGGAVPAAGELRAWLASRLPAHMVPAAFVELGALPLTPAGKVDRTALPSPDRDRPELAVGYAPPEGPAQETLAAIFAEVLGLETVGAHDSFFELGGHSLLLPQVLHRVAAAFGVDVPLRVLYEQPTVAALAVAVEELLLEEIVGVEAAE